MVITIYDIHHKIVPDELVYIFILLSFLQMFVSYDPFAFVVPATLDLLAGPILFIPFFCLWYFSKGIWMGLGDGKLALGIGWFLGLSGGISAIMYAFWMGAAISLILIGYQKMRMRKRLFSKDLGMKSEKHASRTVIR